MNLETLLSEEFVEFSAKIKEVLEKRKALMSEYKKNMNSLVEEAKSLQDAFEQWKAAKETPHQTKATK